MSRASDRPVHVGTHVRITTFGREAAGRVMEETNDLVTVRLPNWLADGVHLDCRVRKTEVVRMAGRPERCRCVYCRGGR